MQPGQGGTPGRVLLVDDSPIVLKVLRTTLEDLGLDVAEAHSPVEAAIYLEEFDPVRDEYMTPHIPLVRKKG